MRLNPYPRGSARPERYYYGRSDELAAVDRFTHEVQASRSSNIICFLAPPGLGKTSLLKITRRKLQEQGWFCGYTEASSDAATAILELLADAQDALPPEGIGKKFRDRLQELSVSAGPVGLGLKLGAEPSPDATNYSRLSRIVASLGALASDAGSGVALLIDEAQVLPQRDLELLMRVVNRHDDLPLAVIIGGLPNIPVRLLGNDDLKRTMPDIWYHSLAPLTAEQSWHALELPAAQQGCGFARNALEHLVGFAEGHPRILQMLGSAAWEAADLATEPGDLPCVSEGHALQAIESVRVQLNISTYPASWRNCSAEEKAVLRAVAMGAGGAAPDGSRVIRLTPGASVAGLNWPEVVEALFGLSGDGVIYPAGFSRYPAVRFVVPGFADYVLAGQAESRTAPTLPRH